MSEHVLDLPERPDSAMAALRRAAEDWGAELHKEESGLWLHLPVVHGLRRGVIAGPVRVEPATDGARVHFEPRESQLYVQPASVVILLLAVFGAAFTVIWPFFPHLLPIAPFGAILALGGWFLVISRLRTSGPDEFLHMVELQAEAGAPAQEQNV